MAIVTMWQFVLSHLSLLSCRAEMKEGHAGLHLFPAGA